MTCEMCNKNEVTPECDGNGKITNAPFCPSCLTDAANQSKELVGQMQEILKGQEPRPERSAGELAGRLAQMQADLQSKHSVDQRETSNEV